MKLIYIISSRVENITYDAGFLGVISTGAPGDGMSIANISIHNSIFPYHIAMLS